MSFLRNLWKRGDNKTGDYSRRRSSTSSVDIDMPNIVEQPDGTKELSLDLHLPTTEHVIAPNVHVKTSKDKRSMLIEVDAASTTEDGHIKHEFHYERRSTLPMHTQTNALKCVFDEDMNTLIIKAPIDEPPTGHRTLIPIEHVRKIQKAHE